MLPADDIDKQEVGLSSKGSRSASMDSIGEDSGDSTTMVV